MCATERAEEEPKRLAQRWRQVSALHRSLQEYPEAVACAEEALNLAPYDFQVRHTLGAALYFAERYAEADPHLRWCIARRPDLKHLQTWLTNGAKMRTEVAQNRQERMLRRSVLSSSLDWAPTSQQEALQADESETASPSDARTDRLSSSPKEVR